MVVAPVPPTNAQGVYYDNSKLAYIERLHVLNTILSLFPALMRLLTREPLI